MLLAPGNPNHITGADLLSRPARALRPAAAGRHDQGLAERVRVPRGARARLKGDAGAGSTRRLGTFEQRVDPNGASEPIRWPLAGPLRATSFDFHIVCSF